MPNIVVEKTLLLVESIGGVGENQPTSPTYNVKSMHMHVVVINYVVVTHSFIVATTFIELEIQ